MKMNLVRSDVIKHASTVLYKIPTLHRMVLTFDWR